jgi:hypothetical protein
MLKASCEVADILRDLYQIKFSEQIFVKSANKKFDANRTRGAELIYRRMYVTKLISVFSDLNECG